MINYYSEVIFSEFNYSRNLLIFLYNLLFDLSSKQKRKILLCFL